MFVRAYLRASTKEQDARRARDDLRRFARERGLKIAAYYTENESGASLKTNCSACSKTAILATCC
jgi:DNA invertase Pin-like site-specific DNA recombinase